MQSNSTDIERIYKESGSEGCAQYVGKKKAEWFDVPLNIAVIGRSGCGKSTFINTIRNLTEDDDGAAEVGAVECTKEIQCYVDPSCPNLKYFDIPGIGTDKFPQKTYLKQVRVDDYDFFLLLASERFSETETYLGGELAKRNKPFYFIRTKVDMDVANELGRRKKNPRSKHVILNELRADSAKMEQTSKTVRVFVICTQWRGAYDFPLLEESLEDDYPTLKREAFAMSSNSMTESNIRKKVRTLRMLIIPAALSSGAVGLVPFPGVSFGFDAALILTHVGVYYRRLCLDDTSLRRIANLYSVEFGRLVKIYQDAFGADFLTVQGIIAFVRTSAGLASAVTLMTVEEFFHFVPVVGSIVGAFASYKATGMILDEILNRMEEVALEIAQVVKEADAANR